MIKKIVIILLLLGVIGVLGYQYIYQDHRDIEKEEAVYTAEATELIKEFVEDTDAASSKYLNKTIEVYGEVTEVEENARTLNEAVYILFEENSDLSAFQQGTKLRVKGRCIGYDELLEIVKLDQSTIIKE